MKSKIIFAAVLTILTIVGLFIWHGKNEKTAPKTSSLASFSLAMDWTPNTNHTGIYVALTKGWYKEQGLDVKILPYSSNTSPDILVTNGKVDVGISATESVIADAATGNPVVSIAAIIQHNTSGFITLADRGINRPRDFDGKLYGGGGSLTESAVVGAIIKKDGGKGNFKNVTLDVEAMQALESKKIDFVWVFEGWEVIQAKRQGYKVNYFPSLQYGIPDYYTPILITSPNEIKQKPALLKKFVLVSKRGYEYAITHPKEAAQLLIDGAPKGTFPDTAFIFASQEFLSAHYVDPGRTWGLQDKAGWHDYPQFLIDSNAVLDNNGKPVKSLNLDGLYTNEFLQ